MAVYNKEAISGYPTGNLSLDLLSKINVNDIHFVRTTKRLFSLLKSMFFRFCRHNLVIFQMRLKR